MPDDTALRVHHGPRFGMNDAQAAIRVQQPELHVKICLPVGAILPVFHHGIAVGGVNTARPAVPDRLGVGQAINLSPLRIDLQITTVRIGRKDSNRGGVTDSFQCGGNPGRLPRIFLALQQLYGNRGQIFQNFGLGRVQLAGFVADHAQRPGIQPFAQMQWGPGVKADIGPARDQIIPHKARVSCGVRYFKNVILQNGMRAERHSPRGALQPVQPDLGLEPLLIQTHQTDQ